MIYLDTGFMFLETARDHHGSFLDKAMLPQMNVGVNRHQKITDWAPGPVLNTDLKF